jgi:hypothetical protein
MNFLLLVAVVGTAAQLSITQHTALTKFLDEIGASHERSLASSKVSLTHAFHSRLQQFIVPAAQQLELPCAAADVQRVVHEQPGRDAVPRTDDAERHVVADRTGRAQITVLSVRGSANKKCSFFFFFLV